MFDAMVASRDR